MNLIKKITYITLFGLTIFSCNSEKKVNISEDSAKDAFNKLTNLVDGFAENSIQKGNANSFAIAIYKDGEMKWRQTGEQDANTLIGLVQQYF